MSEPVVERLSRFTPDAGGLNRDALLFAAGRASARPNRIWMALAAALALSQALTLTLWWLCPTPSAAPVSPPVPAQPAPAAAPEPAAPDASDSPGLWSARRSFLGLELEERPAPAAGGNFVDSGPPLSAFAPLPPSLLN